MAYRPKDPFTAPLMLLIPRMENINGIRKKTFPAVKDGILFYGSFKTYGGSEREVNGVVSVVDTASVETWFRPDIANDCAIANAITGAIYDIEGEPENIEMRNQFLKLKLIRTKGGA